MDRIVKIYLIFLSFISIICIIICGILSLSNVSLQIGGAVNYEIPNSVYERIDEDGTPNPEGDYLYFGSYPQSETGNGYKVERLKWRILDDNYGDGTALIVCNVIVDQIAYQSNYKYIGGDYYATDGSNIIVDDDATIGEGVDSNHYVYANNYKHSELREYLTGTFYNTAFNENEKSSIVLTEVDNSLASTNNNGGECVCENTNDYVFALSLADVKNTEYGYKNGTEDPYKSIELTDYAIANGARIYSGNTGFALLRSPINNSFRSCLVYGGGSYSDLVNRDGCGVVPALQIRL